MDILGQAIADFHNNIRMHKLWVHDNHGPKVEMLVELYFRNEEMMPELELTALKLCKGSVLDIGAGAGSHALWLQDRGFDVTALDISPLAVSTMQDRGLSLVLQQDIFEFCGRKFDTLLLMMNGIGLTASINGLRRFLSHAKTLLSFGGQLLFDSSDVAYLYDEGIPNTGQYYGEIKCRYEYKTLKTDWFTWLYIDQKMLEKIAREEGWKTEILFEDGDDQYLARLQLLN
jgi:SAM-dependent methyltransferase